MSRPRSYSLALALLAPAWLAATATAEVISLVSQNRVVSAYATVTPTNPPGPEQTVDQTHPAPDFGAFEATATASLGAGDTVLGSGEAHQTSSIVGTVVHAAGEASATGACLPPDACGTGLATSSFAIRFTVPVAMMMHVVGGVTTASGTPRLRLAILGPGVALVSDGEGGSDSIDLDALLVPGEYTLEALVEATSGEAGAFQFDATFDAVLVGVEAMRWGDVKQRFR